VASRPGCLSRFRSGAGDDLFEPGWFQVWFAGLPDHSSHVWVSLLKIYVVTWTGRVPRLDFCAVLVECSHDQVQQRSNRDHYQYDQRGHHPLDPQIQKTEDGPCEREGRKIFVYFVLVFANQYAEGPSRSVPGSS
jgi:hypothetical protein